MLDLRELGDQRGTQGLVDRIDRAIALGGMDIAFVAHPHFDGRLGGERTVGEFVGDHPHRLDRELIRAPAGGLAHQQFQRGVSRFEVVALVLQSLEFVDDGVDHRAVHVQAQFVGLDLDRGSTSHLGHDEPGAVTDQFGVDMLIGILGAHDRADVQPRLVGERAGPDIRGLRVERPVEHLGDVVADRGQALEATLGKHIETHLELQVRDHCRQVRVTRPLAEAVDASLHLAGTRLHGGHRVGHRTARVVMAVDRQHHVVAEVGLDRGHDVTHLVG